MFEKSVLGERLLELRKSRNISQQKLAETLGISYHAICKIENKQRGASIEVMYSIADFFEVSIDFIVGRTNKLEVNK